MYKLCVLSSETESAYLRPQDMLLWVSWNSSQPSSYPQRDTSIAPRAYTFKGLCGSGLLPPNLLPMTSARPSPAHRKAIVSTPALEVRQKTTAARPCTTPYTTGPLRSSSRRPVLCRGRKSLLRKAAYMGLSPTLEPKHVVLHS